MDAHHRRRLKHLGRSAQRSPEDDGHLWAAAEPPPRMGNKLDVMIDGAEYLPAFEQAIRAARRSVLIAGWRITPEFAVTRDEPPVLLRELLGEAAESVDVPGAAGVGVPGAGVQAAAFVCSRARTGNTSDPVYVHAKVAIVDDRWLTLGSANLNAHSFFNDTEVNVVTCDAALARETRLRLWASHLERPIDEIDGDPRVVVDELWRPIASEQRARRLRGERRDASARGARSEVTTLSASTRTDPSAPRRRLAQGQLVAQLAEVDHAVDRRRREDAQTLPFCA